MSRARRAPGDKLPADVARVLAEEAARALPILQAAVWRGIRRAMRPASAERKSNVVDLGEWRRERAERAR
jgi:hypothetical protein